MSEHKDYKEEQKGRNPGVYILDFVRVIEDDGSITQYDNPTKEDIDGSEDLADFYNNYPGGDNIKGFKFNVEKGIYYTKSLITIGALDDLLEGNDLITTEDNIKDIMDKVLIDQFSRE